MKEKVSDYCHESAACTVRMLPVHEQVSLRVISFKPTAPSGSLPLVMVSGLSTVIESFRGVLTELTKDFEVHYVETREKPSSQLKGKVEFDIETTGKDLVAVVRSLSLEERNYVLIGYSLGATAAADCFSHLTPKPHCLLLIEPAPVFHFPPWSLFLIRWFGVSLFPLLRCFVNWYIRNVIVNKTEDPEMALIAARALNQADPRKLRSSVLAIAGYQVWDKLSHINCPTLVVCVSKDRLHVHEDITRMVRSIKGCSELDMETNERSHSAEMGHAIRAYINNL
jgi:pimeloyl-ACP methyl ester carboxylesterase